MGPVVALLVQGCLLPQDNQLLSESPIFKNQVPRILEDQLEPSLVTTLQLGSNCMPVPFRASVEDRDLADRIRIRWYVDVESEFQSKYSVSGGVLEPAASTARPPFQSPPALFAAPSPLAVAGQHRLTLVIADGEFIDNGISTLRRPRALTDGGTIDDLTYTDSFTWFVNTSLSPCQ